jgi:hypothetical protein
MKYIEKRTGGRVKSHFTWAKDIDDYLIGLVEIYENGDWWLIKESMSRNFKDFRQSEEDCRNRWRFLMSTCEKRAIWTEHERYNLLLGHQKYRNKWSEVARIMKNTTRNITKNRFYTLFRKVRNKVKNIDFNISSSLDLLETYYVLDLMDQYLKVPPESVNDSKYYALKLAQKMDPKKLHDYRNKIAEIYRNKGTMEQLFKECGDLFGKEDPRRLEEKDETMKCNKIELNEEEGKKSASLAHEGLCVKRRMDKRDKDCFKYTSFYDGEIRSAQATYSALSSVTPSFFSQAQSTGIMREDEGFGFSQFVNPYEGDNKKFNLFPNTSPNIQLSPSFIYQHNHGECRTMPCPAGHGYPMMHSNHSVFSLNSRPSDMMYARPKYPMFSNANSQWKHYPDSQ